MPGIVSLFGPGARDCIGRMVHRIRHRGAKGTTQEIGPSGVVVLLDDGMPVSRAERENWQLAAHLRDYSGSWVDRCGKSAADRLLQHVIAGDQESLAAWNGHFAFIAWDGNRQHLVLGRDSLGGVPLFYALGEGGVVGAASEYKALLAMQGVCPEPDLDMIQQLQFAKNLPPGRTLLANIRAVKPGEIMRFDATGQVVGLTEKWQLSSDVCLQDLGEAKRRTFEALQLAVERRTGGTSPIGIALSGGIDSIALAAICRKLHPDREIYTFTAGYGADDPEVIVAGRVAKLIGSRHVMVETPPDLIRTGTRDLVWHLEDPVARSETLQLLALGRTAGKLVPMLLSAQGADGLFGGMPRHRLIRFMEWLPFAKSAFQQVHDYTLSSCRPSHPLAISAVAYLGRKTPPPLKIRGSNIEPASSQWPDATDNLLNRMLIGWLKSNPKFEHTFAASGLDYTSPFCDPDIIELAFSIDSRLKITMVSQKFVLREALRGLVPDEFIVVPKRPQRMRYDTAFAESLDTLCARILSPEAIEKRGWFDKHQLSKIRKRAPGSAYAPEHAMRLWTAILTEEWARLFIDNAASLDDMS